jgi:predicted transcriptional regulator
VIISLLIILKLIELFFWLLTELIKFIQRVQYRRQIKKEIEKFKDSTIVTVLNFEADSLPEEMRSMKVKFQGSSYYHMLVSFLSFY